jgi:flagellar basal body rod protein FlgB
LKQKEERIMTFTGLDSMGKATLMMDLISQRQRALGSNIANMDTPGYVRRDIDFSQYLGSMNSPIETKLSTALGPSGIMEDRQRQEIDVAEELSELQKNSLMYTMATRRMTNVITMMKTAINVGK